MQRSNSVRAIVDADLFLQRSAHGDSVHCSRSGEGVRSILRLAIVTSYLLFVSPFLRCRGVFFAPVVFSRAAVGLRQLSELRLLLSFFCKRKRTKKIFRGGVPPPRKLPLPRLGRTASRHRLSDASVRHLKCGVRYSLQCSAHKTSEPHGRRFLSSALRA